MNNQNLSNENYLNSEKLNEYSCVSFDTNIITDPKLIPNGLNNPNNVSLNESNNSVLNESNNVVLNESNNVVLNESNNAVLNESNNALLNESNNAVSNESNNALLNELNNSLSESKVLNDSNKKKKNKQTYATRLLNEMVRNKRDDNKAVKEVKNNKSVLCKFKTEIMDVFPISILILLLIFIMLLVFVVGFQSK